MRKRDIRGILGLILGFALTAVSWAKTAEGILSKGTPEEQGETIAVEFDDRDTGYGDVESVLEMVLKSGNGRDITRTQRVRTLQNPGRKEGDKSLITFDSPPDVRGTAFLSHAKILSADDQWLFLPSLNRVKRISSSNKSGPFLGSEFAFEDITSNEIGKYSWKYLGMEEMNGLKCMKLETIPKYELSGYSKRMVWMDAEFFRLQRIDCYDRKGDLLKTLLYEEYKQYLDKFWRAAKWTMTNHQTGKSTLLLFKNFKFGNGFKDSDFTEAVLKRVK